MVKELQNSKQIRSLGDHLVQFSNFADEKESLIRIQ